MANQYMCVSSIFGGCVIPNEDFFNIKIPVRTKID